MTSRSISSGALQVFPVIKAARGAHIPMITSLAFQAPIYIEQDSGSESFDPSKKETAATIAE